MRSCLRALRIVALPLLIAVALKAAEASTLGLQPVASGLASPVALTNAGDGSNRLFIVESAGVVRIHDGTQVLEVPFLDITTKVLIGGERGLLGLAFDANYATNGFFYAFYTSKPEGEVTIARYTTTADLNIADPDSEVILKTQPHTLAGNHNGGGLVFGPDGCLYASIGDGGGGGDPEKNGQDLTTLLGKIIRISPVSGAPCAAAPGNPFVGTPDARGEIWALGLRNPWRIAFDRETGQLFVADVGQAQREEVNVQAPGAAGRNYCWRHKEGTLIFDPDTPCLVGTPTDPVLQYDHSSGNCSITGGYRYRGSEYPGLIGTYFYADFCTGRIWGATEDDGRWTTSLLLDTELSISSFGEDEAGEIYVADLGGAIYRLVAGVGACEATTRLGDSSGDRRSDLAWRHDSGEVGIWLLSGTSITATTSLGKASPDWRLVGTGDLSGDGRADYIWRHVSGAVGAWFLNGVTVTSKMTISAMQSDWTIIGIADVNGDRRADLLWRNVSGAVLVWFMNGGTILSTENIGVAGTGWRVVAIGDFDGDNRADLGWRHVSGVLGVWILNGATIVRAVAISGAVAEDWRVVATADFNADGRNDLLWRHVSGALGVWFLDGTSVPSTRLVGSVRPEWHVAGAGDVSADRRADIIWRHDNGIVGVWLMDGASMTQAASYGGATNSWRIVGGQHDPVQGIEGPCTG